MPGRVGRRDDDDAGAFASKPSISTSIWLVKPRSHNNNTPPTLAWRRVSGTASIFVDEDDARSMLLWPLGEHVANTGKLPFTTNISTKSEPEMKKKGTFAPPATARARSYWFRGLIIKRPFWHAQF
jgi:hypothetical protein